MNSLTLEQFKHKKKLKDYLLSAEETERMTFPYENIEVHLLGSGYEHAYETLMPEQNRAKIKSKPEEPGYWSEYAKNFPHKTRAAAAVAFEMEERGAEGVTAEIRAVLDKVVSLARGA